MNSRQEQIAHLEKLAKDISLALFRMSSANPFYDKHDIFSHPVDDHCFSAILDAYNDFFSAMTNVATLLNIPKLSIELQLLQNTFGPRINSPEANTNSAHKNNVAGMVIQHISLFKTLEKDTHVPLMKKISELTSLDAEDKIAALTKRLDEMAEKQNAMLQVIAALEDLQLKSVATNTAPQSPRPGLFGQK